MIKISDLFVEYQCQKCDKLNKIHEVTQYENKGVDITKIEMKCKCRTYIGTVEIHEQTQQKEKPKRGRPRKNFSSGVGEIPEE